MNDQIDQNQPTDESAFLHRAPSPSAAQHGAGERPRPDAFDFLSPGSFIADRYELIEQLGSGAMGVVWKAEDTNIEREVAIKFLNPAVARIPKIHAGLRAEAQNLAKLQNHQNIVNVFDFFPPPGQEDPSGLTFIVMEYVEGTTALDELRDAQGDLPKERVFRWARALAAALDYAHESNIIHRDIKPNNIMIRRSIQQGGDEQALLADFGICHRPDRNLDSTINVGRSSSRGTPPYASPQQAHDQDRDPAAARSSDIFSFAATIYHLLANKPPFGSGGAAATPDDPDPIPDVPDQVNHALAEALSRVPYDRPGSATELVNRFGDAAPAPIRNAGATRKRAGSRIAIALLIALPIAAVTIAAVPDLREPVRDFFVGQDADETDTVALADDTDGNDNAERDTGDPPAGGDPDDDQAVPDQSPDDGTDGGEGASPDPERDDTPTGTDDNGGEQESERSEPDDINDVIERVENREDRLQRPDETIQAPATSDNAPPFHQLIMRGDTDEVRRELQAASARGDLTELLSTEDTNRGYLPIHVAAFHDRAEIIRLLVAHGAEADQTTESPDKSTPLHVAADRAASDAITALIEVGAKPNVQNEAGNTPLHELAESARNPTDIAVLRQLIDAGADRRVLNRRGRSAAELVPRTSRVRTEALNLLDPDRTK